ncbi:C40 family peptidase [Pectobacterium brasiliense]|uniref:C40 family peptidase n=1 Tax=Pectobacterium brasiliense TaxID=180957 RepID=UPI000B95EE38|nr:C40 family peptidase [Pectobacterium carotovorum]OYN52656.1 peptidase P60 [Pectobacterium carotovorum]
MLTKKVLAAVQRHAEQSYPKESCGLIIRAGRAHEYVECVNTHTSPGDEFRIAPDEYAAAEDAGEVVAVVHSHPDATSRPSSRDLAMCEETGLPWVIISWPEGDVRTIVPQGAELEIKGRPFVHGVWDCYGLIRDWYQRERGITLLNFEREDEWWKNGGDLYRDHYAEAGFYRHDGPLLPGDVVVMQYMSDVPNHAGVYIGDEKMLHHLYGQRAGIVPYGGFWQERTILTLRYSK